jgi:hypothetical protein
MEGVMNVGVQQSGTRRGNEQRGRASPAKRSISSLQITGESADAACVQWQFTGLPELSVANNDQAVDRIKVITIEGDRFPNPHPSYHQQPDQCSIGRYPV